jgi:site-specific recombinase XerD
VASLTKLPNSPFWIARLRVWVQSPEHPLGGFYRQTMRSTKLPHATTPRRTAKRTADEMEQTARELRTAAPDAAWFAHRLESLMRAAGVESPRARATWDTAAESWLAAKDAAPRSIERYRTDIAHFARFLGTRRRHDLRTVTPDDISGFYHGLLESGLSATSAQHITKTIRSVFRRAVLLKQCDTNPADLLRMRGPQAATGRRPFSREEVADVLAYIEREKLAEWRTAVLLGLYYGMRLGDAVARRFEEVATVDGLRVLRFVPAKKARLGREVVVPLVGDLAKLRGRGHITPALAALGPGVASKAFARILDAAGIERKTTKKRGLGRGLTDKTFHSLRHTANSWMVDAGVDQRVRQLVCDHDDVRVSHRYTHASLATMSEAIGRSCRLGATSLPENASRRAPRRHPRTASPRGQSTP